MHRMIFSLFLALMGMTPFVAQASEEGVALKEVHISMDQKTLQKGVEVVADVCNGCHSLKYVTYRDLMDYPEIGLTREQVDELRGDRSLNSGMITSLSPEDAKISYGKVPPDLSVISRARRGGAAYIYSILTGYEHDEHGRIPDGNYNLYFPGNNIAMPDPLSWLDHDPEETADIEEQARAVASLLAFVADPHQLERQRIGYFVLGFLALITIVVYFLKREVWRDVKH